tara:strand:+ start:3372 stop:4007 length:636 start_codon:yes stop_codon:yes gene_type:complete
MESPRYKSTFGFIDLLFNLLVGFVFLFFIAYVLINPIAKQGIITPPDKIIIEARWTKASIADIDLWMMDPAQQILSFQNKTIPGAHLEKDDLGASNDTVWVNGKKVTNPNNNEVIHIQTLQPGTYYVSVHMYNNRTEKGPHKVTVKIRSLDPYRTLVEKEVILKKYGQEIGIVSFKVSETNSVYDVDNYSGGLVIQELQNQYNQHRDTRAP